MIGAFPRRDGWATLCLAADSDYEQPVLLELAGDCPGDPDARPVRVTACADPHDALVRAAERLAAGWAAYASAERPAPSGFAAAALRAPARAPAPGSPDRELPADAALAVVAHAAAARPDRFRLFPNPTARR
jgi:hypothetical protein